MKEKFHNVAVSLKVIAADNLTVRKRCSSSPMCLTSTFATGRMMFVTWIEFYIAETIALRVHFREKYVQDSARDFNPYFSGLRRSGEVQFLSEEFHVACVLKAR